MRPHYSADVVLLGIGAYLKFSCDDFLKEPPDSDFLRGYLSALLDVAGEMDVTFDRKKYSQLMPPKRRGTKSRRAKT